MACTERSSRRGKCRPKTGTYKFSSRGGRAPPRDSATDFYAKPFG